MSTDSRPTQTIRRVVLALVFFMLILTGILVWPSLAARFHLSSLDLTAAPPLATNSPTASASPTRSPAPLELTSSQTPQSPVILGGQPFAPFDRGLILVALDESGYSHLFAYQPGGANWVRLTDGPWQDTDPSISPDGKTIAFASNRDGQWDLYTMNLASGETSRLTETPEYDGAPDWSPDSRWMVHETYVSDEGGGNLELFIRPVDNSQEPIRLTFDPNADIEPAWSPQGRQIIFISTRTGESEVWLADLDRVDQRFQNLSVNKDSREAHPGWSSDGSKLSWTSVSKEGFQTLFIWDLGQSNIRPQPVNTADWNAWSPADDAMLVSLLTPNQTYLTGYNLLSSILTLPILLLEGSITGMTWGDASLPKTLPAPFEQTALISPTPIWTRQIIPGADIPGGRQHIVPLEDVEAPNALLSDRVDESFFALRQRVALEVGWDFLATLEQAYLPLTSRLGPGMVEDWLYTGRAFRFNTAPMSAGWLVVMREDYGPQTYWRVFLRTRFQDGSQGEPLKSPPWDITARFSGDPQAYEQGGALMPAIPPGYWLDFTRLAAAYGWSRQPALSSWRLSYSSARMNEFTLTDGLDWLSAMSEVYPREALDTPTPVPTVTETPIPSLTPTKTLTPTRTPWHSRTPTPTNTPWPSRTPSPTATPTATRTPTITLSPTPTPRENVEP